MKEFLKPLLGVVALTLGLSGTPPSHAANINVSGEITGTTTWYSTNVYTMTAPVYVLSNAVLNIQPGTLIWGAPSDESNPNNIIFSALFVCQGGKLFAEGTPNNPIVFTAQYDYLNTTLDYTIDDTGLWGGVVLLGNAVLNTASSAAGNVASPKYDVYEGLADSTASTGQHVFRYGGNNNADSSGVMRYVSIRHGGTSIKTDKEINGLSLCCVGSGTVIEYVEAFANSDDGFEFFGGTVNTKHLVSAFCLDEEFDIDQGYRGKSQFWFGIHPENYSGQFGGEWNGEPNGSAASNAPMGKFTIYNMTLVGSGPDQALRVRDYAAPQVYNSVFTEFKTRGIRVDDPGSVFFSNGTIKFQETLWNTNTGPSSPAANDYVFNVTALSNVFANPLLTGISYAQNSHGLDPRPKAASPALFSSVTAPNDGFLTPVSYKGAFVASNNWAVQWTAMGEYCVMSPSGGVNESLCEAVAPVCPQPTLSIKINGANVGVSWASTLGCNYQLQSKSPITGSWGSVGGLVAGDGTTKTVSVPATGTQQYFQVEVQ